MHLDFVFCFVMANRDKDQRCLEKSKLQGQGFWHVKGSSVYVTHFCMKEFFFIIFIWIRLLVHNILFAFRLCSSSISQRSKLQGTKKVITSITIIIVILVVIFIVIGTVIIIIIRYFYYQYCYLLLSNYSIR